MEPVAAEKFDRELEGALLGATAYAVRLCRALYGGGVKAQVRTQVIKSAEEYVNEAITLTLEGKRPWKHTSVALAAHLSGVVRSLISNELHSSYTRTRDGDRWDEVVDTRADASVKRPITPEEFYLSKEECDEIEKDAYEAAGDDEVLTALVQAVADGAFEVGEVAKMTGFSSEKIYLAKDKLKKRYKRKRK